MYKHFYCSNKCRDKGYGALYSGENSVHYNTIKDKCFYCKGYFERWESQILSAKRSYCSKECRAKDRSEEHTSELQSRGHLVCRLLLEKKKNNKEKISALIKAEDNL